LVLSHNSRLAERVRETLRSEIQRGRWTKQLPSERKLSKEFQVSRPTIRLALRALQKEDIVHIQPGQPSAVVKRLRKPSPLSRRRPEVILVRNDRIKPDVTSVTLVTDLLRQRLHRLGYGLQIKDAFPYGVKKYEQALSEIDRDFCPAFYLLTSVPPSVHRWFDSRGLPALILGSRTPDVHLPAIEVDPEARIRHGVQYLVRRGHRCLGLLQSPLTTLGQVRYHQAFLDCCARESTRGVRGIIQTILTRPHALENAVRRMFDRAGRPTAVIVTNLEFTIGVYSMLGELGLYVPRDVSVITCYHYPLLDFLRPVPTRYEFSWEVWANRVVRIFRNYLRIGVLPNQLWNIIPTLRAGRSVAGIPTT
jgi:DNA-binding LacI/PurR family transcriptional regulator